MKDDDLSAMDERLTRWIDGAMSEIERRDFERELESDPARADWQKHKAGATALGSLLREHLPDRIEPPFPDFFNSQVLRKIRESQPSERRDSAARSIAVIDWLKSRWLVAAAAAAVLVAIGAVALGRKGQHTEVLSVYSPEPNATAHTWFSRSAHAAVIEVNGLADFPTDRNIVGNNETDAVTLVAALER
jgi:anti-sigma factor RsiW